MQQSPMIQRIKESATMHTDDLLISIICGTILAVLAMSFIV